MFLTSSTVTHTVLPLPVADFPVKKFKGMAQACPSQLSLTRTSCHHCIWIWNRKDIKIIQKASKAKHCMVLRMKTPSFVKVNEKEHFEIQLSGKKGPTNESAYKHRRARAVSEGRRDGEAHVGFGFDPQSRSDGFWILEKVASLVWCFSSGHSAPM